VSRLDCVEVGVELEEFQSRAGFSECLDNPYPPL